MDDRPERIARDLIQQLEDGWNAADGEAFGDAFTEDADFVAIRGDYHRSREAIAKGIMPSSTASTKTVGQVTSCFGHAH